MRIRKSAKFEKEIEFKEEKNELNRKARKKRTVWRRKRRTKMRRMKQPFGEGKGGPKC